MDNQEKRKNYHHGEKEQKDVLGIDGNNKNDQEDKDHRVIKKHQQSYPQKRNKQALENPGYSRHGRRERHRLGRVKRGNSENNSSC